MFEVVSGPLFSLNPISAEAFQIVTLEFSNFSRLHYCEYRVPRDMNSLRTVESILGVDTHSKHVRRAVAFHVLVACLDNKVA